MGLDEQFQESNPMFTFVQTKDVQFVGNLGVFSRVATKDLKEPEMIEKFTEYNVD